VEQTSAGLTPFQVAVAELFFSLPESDGFLLAGGAALAAQHLTSRPTQDLDLFTRAGCSTVPSARDAFDVYTLAERYATDLLLHRAMQIDPGFDPAVLATMIGSLSRFDDDEIPIAPCDVAVLRDFFRRWQLRLQSGHAAEPD
jgi:hypothetical protein